jgi:hypothetical protein
VVTNSKYCKYKHTSIHRTNQKEQKYNYFDVQLGKRDSMRRDLNSDPIILTILLRLLLSSKKNVVPGIKKTKLTFKCQGNAESKN